MDEAIQEFLVESTEYLDSLERDLVGLETVQDPTETVKSLFRALHTIKGTAGMLGFSRLEHLSHAAESLLGKMRDEKLPSSNAIVTALLGAADAMRNALSVIGDTEAEPETDYSELVSTLEKLQCCNLRVPRLGVLPPVAEPESQPSPPPPNLPLPDPLVDLPALGEVLHRYGVSAKSIVAALHAQEKGDPRRLGEILVRRGAVSPALVERALSEQSSQRQAQSVADNSIRVNVSLLDTLMNLVGELVLVRNQIVRQTAPLDDTTLSASAHRLNLVTSELQEGVMKTRMQPIGTIWSKFPRLVRDLSQKLGKQIRIEMEGKSTELDKTILEAVKDPLTHIVRNCVDHGIETPDEREFDGKSLEGLLSLRAFHEGGYVNIEVSDDGQGIDVDKVRSVAVERGVVSVSRAAKLSEREVIDLIFAPGFSTAAEVTSVSGRGVGMDVVKTNIERIGGTIDVTTSKGRGSSFRIRIPLTLAIIPALIVKTGDDERLAIPQVSLLELVRLEGDQRRSIERIRDAAVYRLRGNLLPLVFLEELLYGDRAQHDRDVTNIVVLQTDAGSFGLVVREVHDTEEIVVKPLGREFKGLDVFAGATIMGDGRIALIVDVNGVANRAGITSDATVSVRPGGGRAEDAHTQSLLVVAVGEDRHIAIPLAEVERLEDVDSARMERAGLQWVVQYRGGLMPIVDVGAQLFDRPLLGTRASYTTVVHRRGERTVGLAVDRLVDIVEEHVVVDDNGRRPGVRGSSVVQGRVLELVDVGEVVALSGVIRSTASALGVH